jgi:hypothetical protein
MKGSFFWGNYMTERYIAELSQNAVGLRTQHQVDVGARKEEVAYVKDLFGCPVEFRINQGEKEIVIKTGDPARHNRIYKDRRADDPDHRPWRLREDGEVVQEEHIDRARMGPFKGQDLVPIAIYGPGKKYNGNGIAESKTIEEIVLT